MIELPLSSHLVKAASKVISGGWAKIPSSSAAPPTSSGMIGAQHLEAAIH
jgi:hypothetical protein